MIQKSELKVILENEKELYGIGVISSLWGFITNYNRYRIWKWLYSSRKYDYYSQFYHKNFIKKIIAIYYLRKKNKLGEKLGLDIGTRHIGKGLLIHHPGATVINGRTIIGDNCILHGNNCIGNKGPKSSPCPIIGNNVEIGVGAKIIGGVTIADDIVIGAGAVVVDSFLEKGIIIGGVPARKLS